MIQTNFIHNWSLPFLFALLLLGTSCARQQTFYHVDTDPIEAEPNFPEDSLQKRIILLGDIAAGKDNSALSRARKNLTADPQKSIFVFLGDQVNKNRFGQRSQQAREELARRLAPFANLNSESYFLGGDKDWGKIGPESVEKQEKFLQDSLSEHFHFIPDDGCGGPETIELGENLVLIAINSAWILSDWDDFLQVNRDCDLRTRDRFYLELEDEIKKYYRTHNVIIAMHHPVMSVGYRGGYYSIKDHLFPINNSEDYFPLPLPGIGTISSFFRSKIGNRKDLIHPQYREFSDRLDDFKRDYPGLILVAGHDHSLQYFKVKDQHYVVSGSSTLGNAVRDMDEAIFGHGGLGYSTLDVYKDGSVYLNFYGKSKKGNEHELIFHQQIKDAFTPTEQLMPDSFPIYDSGKPTITTAVLKPGEIKKFNKTWWGELHREYYFREVEVPILDLDTIYGGLTPIRRGGGFQTNSLHLVDTADHLYKLRSLRKESDRLLPWPFNKTFASNIAAYLLTAGNPYGALALDKMAEAIDIYYTTPNIFYLPQQPRLGKYIDIPPGLYLLEERPDEDWRTLDHFGYSKNIISNSKMVEERLESDKAVIDQKWTIRTRLFDMVIGDWDRHVDQWRWSSQPIEGTDRTLYRPIPRDRDQVFSKYDGIIPNILRQSFPFLRATQSFDYTIKKNDVKWMNRQARNFDRLFLNELSWEDWEEQVKKIQSELTDEVIAASIRRIPPEIYNSGIGEEWIAKLKQRRDDLMQYAREYYTVLYNIVQIPATHKENLIEVKRLDDSQTRVTIYEYRDNKTAKDLIYENTFSHGTTGEIIVYGLDDDDEFVVEGEVNQGILVRLVGGNGEDSFIDESRVSGIGRKTRIYDTPEGTGVEKSAETNQQLSNRKMTNTYSFHGNYLNYGFPFPVFGYNPDDGVFVGFNYLYNGFGFKKKNTQNLTAKYAFETSAYSLRYKGNFLNLLGSNDLYLETDFDGPQFVLNYFGIGNETEKPDLDKDFWRVRRSRIFLYPALQRRFNDSNTRLRLGPIFERLKVERTPDRILTSETTDLPANAFTGKNYLGGELSFIHRNVDKRFFPQNGIIFNSSVSYRANMEDYEQNFVNFQADLRLYQCLDKYHRFFFATRIGFEHLIGDYEFHQAATIGGNDNLRGFRRERFNGNTAFYHNLDMRIKLFDLSNSPIPTSIGITAGFDYGRVWVEGEDSDKWHYGYGGQVWIAPLNYLVLSTGVFMSEEDRRFVVRLGFTF